MKSKSLRLRIKILLITSTTYSALACNNTKKVELSANNHKKTIEQSSDEIAVSSWTADQLLEEQIACTTENNSLKPLEASATCNCFVKEAASRWTFETFSKDRNANIKKLKDDGVLEQCMGQKPVDNGVTQNTKLAQKKWESPQLLETDDAGKAWKSKLAISEGNNIAVVWSQNDGAKFNVMARVLFNNQWTNTEIIAPGQPSEAQNIPQEPEVAFSREKAVAIWTLGINQVWQVLANDFDPATQKWNGAVVLTNHTAAQPNYHHIHINKSGVGHIIWQLQTDAGPSSLQGRAYDNGTWSPMLTISSGSGNGLMQGTDVKTLPNGDAIAIWAQNDTSGATTDNLLHTWVNRYNFANKTWGTPKMVDKPDGHSSVQPILGSLSDGKGVAVWMQTKGSSDSKIFVAIETNNGWGTPECISGESISDAATPRLGVDQYDNIHVVWYRLNDGGIYTRTYSHNQGWQAGITQIGTGSGANKGWFPEVFVHPSGIAVTTWAQWDGTRYNPFANRYDGKQWGSPEAMPRLGNGDATFPRAVINNNSDVFGIYYQDTTRPDVWSIWLR